jgi:hypothetical protein
MGGADLGHGYSGAFQPMDDDMGDVSDESFPDLDLPEEVTSPETTEQVSGEGGAEQIQQEPATNTEQEQLNQSVSIKTRNDVILETLERFKDKVDELGKITIDNITFVKVNGIFVRQ